MKNKFTLTVTDIYKFKNGHTCLVGTAEPKNHKLIMPGYVGKIILDSSEERELNILGQDIFARNPNVPRVEVTAIRTTDNIDDIIQHLGKKSIVVIGYLPD